MIYWSQVFGSYDHRWPSLSKILCQLKTLPPNIASQLVEFVAKEMLPSTINYQKNFMIILIITLNFLNSTIDHPLAEMLYHSNSSIAHSMPTCETYLLVLWHGILNYIFFMYATLTTT